MRFAVILYLCAALVLTALGAARAQDAKPPDYKSKPLEKWIEALRGDDHQLRIDARAALGPQGPYAKDAVAAIIDSFAKARPTDHDEAIETLADHGQSAVPALVKALKRPEAPVRVAAAETLGQVRPKPFDAVPALVDAVNDSSPEVRSAAADSLGGFRRSPDKILPSLEIALRDGNDDVRAAAARALSEMGRKSKPALPALIVALKDKNGNVRKAAAWAVREIGPDAKSAVPALIEGLRDRKLADSHVRFAQALGGIGPEAKDAAPILVEALKEKDFMIRRWATDAIGEIGPSAKAAVPALMAAASDRTNSERDLAIAALGKIGPDAKAAVPVLIEMLAKGESYLYFRCGVARALGGIGPDAAPAVPLLSAIARNRFDGGDINYPPTRQAASEAVMKIDPEYGKKHGIELAYLDVRLGIIPPMKLAPRAALTEEKRKQIKTLIANLADLKDPDFGLSATLTGSSFAPLPGRDHFGMGLVFIDHRLKTSSTLRSLVELGPDALPFLLEALGDKTPTKLKIEPVGMMSYGEELSGNPLNAQERRILAPESARKTEDDDDGGDRRFGTLSIGDVCFVAIGQIVGRPYSAVRYQPSLLVVINSPVESKELRDRVRAIWSSNNPAQKLLDSLLIDYATEGIFNGKSLDGWGEASERQIEAAVRLLYYFPKESVPVVADRLKDLDVKLPKADKWMLRDVANRVHTTDFLKALTWCKEPLMRDAMLDIFRRTDDLDVALAVLPSVNQSRPELVVPYLRAEIKKLPESEKDARGNGHDLLLALGEYAGKGAKTDYENYLRDGSLQRRETMCWVLEKIHPEWALEFLTPMLTDRGIIRDKLRVCDRAAMALSETHPDLKFELEGTFVELDRRIKALREQISRRKPK